MVPILILGTLCFTFLGMTISNFAQRETQVSLLCNIIGMPMTFCSNAFYSLNGAPGWLKVLSNILPLNHLIEGIHAALDGNAAGMLAPAGILAAYTVFAVMLAVVTFRWDSDTTVTQRFLRRA